MTRLIEVTESPSKQITLINIDLIVKVTADEYVAGANAKISLNNSSDIFVTETVDQIKSMCNS